MLTPVYHTERWETWKKEYSQVYKSDEIEQNRRAIWESNMQFVNEHNANADKVGFTVEMNEFAALVSSYCDTMHITILIKSYYTIKAN